MKTLLEGRVVHFWIVLREAPSGFAVSDFVAADAASLSVAEDLPDVRFGRIIDESFPHLPPSLRRQRLKPLAKPFGMLRAPRRRVLWGRDDQLKNPTVLRSHRYRSQGCGNRARRTESRRVPCDRVRGIAFTATSGDARSGFLSVIFRAECPKSKVAFPPPLPGWDRIPQP